MSIASFFESGERTQDKGHVKNLVLLAQVDGHVTDNSNPPSVVPSAATSVNPTPDTSPVKPVIPPAFLDQLRECHSSLEWDYQDVDVLENAADLDDVFDLPYADVDFMARHASI